MTPERNPAAATVDWAQIAALPTVTADAGDLDVVELVQRDLIAPTLRFSHAALAVLGAVDTVVINDPESTPLLLGRLRAGLLEVTTLRSVARLDGEAASLAEAGPFDLAVVVCGMPSTADLVRVDALTAPHSRVLWLVLAGHTRAGRQLLADLPGVVDARARGAHRIVRVPWPTAGSRGVFERPRLPTPKALAEAFGVKHFVVVGELPGADVPRHDRGGTVVFFTGLSGSGKSTLAKALRDFLEQESQREVTLLDGDDVRRMLSAGLGFDTAGREANVRRTSWVAALLARHGGIAITALIAPFAEGRAEAARMARDGADFLQVWVSTPLAECERRDRKGLYARARAGELANFTGIDSPYEPPDDADLVIDTTGYGIDEAVKLVVAELEARALRRGQELGRRTSFATDDVSDEELTGYDI
ncbi:adenylyl-sulfate kinase [Micropruina sp.]|uniref:adenylyl-sulfate kinase n=1 Tax=Micropruina sp. TaxID=2737536 RepID=UPI0039E58B1A